MWYIYQLYTPQELLAPVPALELAANWASVMLEELVVLVRVREIVVRMRGWRLVLLVVKMQEQLAQERKSVVLPQPEPQQRVLHRSFPPAGQVHPAHDDQH